VIDSIKDERIVFARTLTSQAGRVKAGRCLLEGARLIENALEAGAAFSYVLYGTQVCDPELEKKLVAAGIEGLPVRDGLLAKVTGAARSPGWLAVATLPSEVDAAAGYGDFALVCENVADPGNLGTIVRTARALGVSDVVLTDDETDLSSRRVLDAARASVLTARVRRFRTPAEAIDGLKKAGFQVVVTSPRGSHLQALAPLAGKPVALVVGNETDGVSAETLAAADLAVQIPMAGQVESLNVGVATGISLYELRMRMVLAMLTDRIRESLGRELAITAHLSRAAFDLRLAEVGDVTADQAIALMIVACERETPLSVLRRDLGLEAAELPAVLDPLTDRGYVETTSEVTKMTSAGEQALAALWAVQDRITADLQADLSEAEQAQLKDLLRRIQANAVKISQA
jgi:TrmH family RNA methyltransferase